MRVTCHLNNMYKLMQYIRENIRIMDNREIYTDNVCLEMYPLLHKILQYLFELIILTDMFVSILNLCY